MQVSKVNIMTFSISNNRFVNSIKTNYTDHVKPSFKNGYEHLKDLPKDTVEFVRKNPQKASTIFSLSVLGLGLIAAAVKFVKDANRTREISKIKSEHIMHQREIIDSLKEDIAQKQFMIDSLHDGINAKNQDKPAKA